MLQRAEGTGVMGALGNFQTENFLIIYCPIFVSWKIPGVLADLF